MQSVRRLLEVTAVASVIALLVAAAMIVVLRSTSFSNYVRGSVLAALEKNTGARADIRSFEFDWQNLTVHVRGLTLHGTETTGEPPLLSVPALDVQLKILSLLGRRMQIQSLSMQSPRLQIFVRPDGSTNLPGPSVDASSIGEIVRQLLLVQIPTVEIHNGEAQINDQRISLNLVSRNVQLALAYRRTQQHFELAVHSDSLQLEWNAQWYKGAVALAATLWRNGVSVQDARFDTPDLHLALSGQMQNFVSPTVDWHLQSRFATAQLARTLDIEKELYGGAIAVEGSGHKGPNVPLAFSGEMTAHGLNARIQQITLHNATVASPLTADLATLRLTKAEVTTPEVHFAGQAELTHLRDLRVIGLMRRIDVPTVISSVMGRPLPVAATAAGPLELSATLLPHARDLTAATDLQLTAGSGALPVSGDLHLSYRQKTGTLEFRPSRLSLPHTILSATGLLPSKLQFALESTNLIDLTTLLASSGHSFPLLPLPVLSGSARASGTLFGNNGKPSLTASIAANGFVWEGQAVDLFSADLAATTDELALRHLIVRSPLGSLAADFQTQFSSGRLQSAGRFSAFHVDSFLRLADPRQAPIISGGLADGTFSLDGTLSNPQGSAELTAHHVSIRGEPTDSLHASLTLHQSSLQIAQGWLRFAKSEVDFSGSYLRAGESWERGALRLNLDADAVPLPHLQPLLPALPNVSGTLTVHAQAITEVGLGRLTPRSLAGKLTLQNLAFDQVPAGNLRLTATTSSGQIHADLTGDLRGSPISGNTDLQIAPGTPAIGELHFAGLNLESLAATLHPKLSLPPLTGTAAGDLSFSGPLERPRQVHALLRLQHVEVSDPGLQRLSGSRAIPQLLFQNQGPVTIEIADGVAKVRQLELAGRDTHLALSGTATLAGSGALALHLNGALNLRSLQTLYPQWQIGGASTITASIAGTLANPTVAGSAQLVNGSVVSPDLPNGLSNLHGTIRFDGNRATLEGVEAHTGGGQVSLSGFATYARNRSIIYRLEARGQNVRVRYANGISVTGNSQLSLAGTESQALLTGSLTVSRIVFNPSTDLGNLLALTANSPASAVDSRSDFLSRLGLDLRIDSSPDLQLDTALSTGIQAEIDLQLRGTPRQPIFLGSIEANEGDIKVFGSRYTINRGQISFTNPVKIEPVLDLDLQTQTRGITVDITVSGTLGKLNLNYRSDPPLQPRDIIALLTVGRTPDIASNVPNVQVTNDASVLQSGANTVLGQAISPVSNRLSKLFGITNIRIDPLVQGIANTPQARLTLEQQVSRQITVTYVTNLSQMSEQVFRVEYSLSPQFSLVALRDDNGEFGIDILYKKRFK